MNSLGMTIIQWLLNLVIAYLAGGLTFGIFLVIFGLERLDPKTPSILKGLSKNKKSPLDFLDALFFRLLLLPGISALWPLLAIRLWNGRTPPKERNAHRKLAAKQSI